MHYAGLVIDIDGTLLRQRDTEIIEELDLRAIQMLVRRQVPVVVVTGRTCFRARPLLEHLGVRDPAIVLLGAQTFDLSANANDELLPIDEEEVERLVAWGKNHGCPAHIVTPRGTLLMHAREPAERLANLWPFLPLTEMQDASAAPLQVALPIRDPSLRATFLQFVEQEEVSLLLCMQRDRITGLNPQTDKGLALRRLAARRQWDLRTFIAMGNDLTDAPVFAEVGLGIAVGQRHPELVACAHRVLAPETPALIAACIAEYLSP